MIEYTIKEDNNEILACFTSDPYVCEINITGLTNEDEIQLRLSSVLEQIRNLDD